MSIGRRSLADVAYETLRAAISAGDWPPGYVLVEKELTQELGMSRTPIREALRRLQADMFLEVGRAGGAVVPERGRRDLILDYMIRAELEGLAASLAAKRISQDELAVLESLTDKMIAGLQDHGSPEDYLEMNEDFHARMVQASGYDRLITFHEVLRDTIRVASRKELSRSTPDELMAAVEEHRQITNALRNRGEDAARDLARHHVLKGVIWLTHKKGTPSDGHPLLPDDRQEDLSS